MKEPDFVKEVCLHDGWLAVERAYCEAKSAGCQWAEARGWPADPEHLTVYGFVQNPNEGQ